MPAGLPLPLAARRRHLDRLRPGIATGELAAVVGEHLAGHLVTTHRRRADASQTARPVGTITTAEMTTNREWS